MRFNSAAATVEQFKPIPFVPRYQVSDKANVRNARTVRILKSRAIPAGHRQVLLYRDDAAPTYQYVHRLAALVHIGPPPR
ncbi:MAG: NUMOD4 domain-containing protein [Paludisphaera borealis]|uniref:NUMOD4 domain-containing protein n=1 Tax=Paludisphaera borealis TaxID=1387353 RepID=UPI00283D6266|nr:NUMOD4 domain-containing protein [Paludisphaera borealis]MDR3618760.1 NUMOD4 domain-containing protein [Paludisphaera borealis]